MRRARETVRRAWWGGAVVLVAACAGGADGEGGAAATSNSSAESGAGVSAGASAGAPGQNAATASEVSTGAPTVLIAGTSLTAGLGLDPEYAYPAVVQELADSVGLPARVVNAGLSGETSAGLLRRIDWLLRDPAEVVVIETGANDGLRGVDPDSTQANLRRIVERVQAVQPRARVLLVQMEAPPNLGEAYTGRFRAMYREVAQETGAGLVPFLLEGVAGVTTLNQGDGIHPNEAGARILARTMWGVLRPILDSLDRAGMGG